MSDDVIPAVVIQPHCRVPAANSAQCVRCAVDNTPQTIPKLARWHVQFNRHSSVAMLRGYNGPRKNLRGSTAAVCNALEFRDVRPSFCLWVRWSDSRTVCRIEHADWATPAVCSVAPCTWCPPSNDICSAVDPAPPPAVDASVFAVVFVVANQIPDHPNLIH